MSAQSTAPSLQNAAINLLALKQGAKQELEDVLDRIKGKKIVALDTSLSGPLALIFDKQLLTEHGVDRTFHVTAEPPVTDCKQVLYIVRPTVEAMEFVVRHMRVWTETKVAKEVSVCMVPRRTIIAERVLADAGLFDRVRMEEFGVGLIPFEDDLLSLELPHAFKDLYLDHDRTALYYVAKSLMKLQSMFGLIPQIRGKGVHARLVADMLLKMKTESSAFDDLAVTGEIDELILIDRECDMVTPLLTELTYEGLIDELYGIHNGCVELSPEIANAEVRKDAASAVRKVRVPLNNNDSLFSELRDLNFNAVAPRLKAKAKSLQDIDQERHKLQEKGVSQIKEFVTKLKEMNITVEKKLASFHTNLASDIGLLTRDAEFLRKIEVEQALLEGRDGKVNDFIEDAIYKNDPPTHVLRLICLQSLLCNGLKRYDFYKRELILSYGFEMMLTLESLEKIGIFKKSEARSAWPAIKKAFKLVTDDVSELEPNDISYVYSGYAPLSVRLVQHASRPQGWRGLEDSLKLLPGPHFEEVQAEPSESARTQQRTKVVMVFFIGGCTFTEISAVRFLAKQNEGQCEYVIGTTKLLSGDKLMSSVIQTLGPEGASLKR